MKSKKTRLYISSPHMSGDEQKYIQEAFDQNWIAPLGPNVDAFESAIAGYCNVNHVAALSSGTASIHLALVLLGVQKEDEVLVSTFTFSASVNPIIYQGAKPVFIDSEPETWNMDPILLKQALEERKLNGKLQKVKAIIVVHLYGMPAKMDEIMEIASTYGIPVIEDAAEALGSQLNGKPLGSFGELGILSFNGNKIITTSGGGALLSNEKAYIEKARFLATQARDQAPHYQHSEIGYNYRMSNVLAGLGRGQMEVIDERVKKRRENFVFYWDIFKGIKGVSFQPEPEGFYSNRWLTTIIINPEVTGIQRLILQQKLEEENIETRPLWKPMHLQPVFKCYDAYLTGVSEALFNNGLCLPSGSNLDKEDRDRIKKALSMFFSFID
ncbi:DegT/DnrJ/EryC1/StrS family aminotransferase [Carboxylicivirga caseinilyticus]|uniref:DegT/DnrJ/EryC1/StrS family aminotransferase n=1 Tax=Carboxylicivirga caseinilyticus TaxID=3417572 RepID=UPI003D352CB9|nr:aminotransferase class I/II-fold pyridoxal phosphate-dependent enzyme [Marinilabiliaceae bacterium A049]